MAHPKYGQNEAHSLMMCPRCSDAVPVFIRTVTTEDSLYGKMVVTEYHCRKCQYYGHKDGTMIQAAGHSIFPRIWNNFPTNPHGLWVFFYSPNRSIL